MGQIGGRVNFLLLCLLVVISKILNASLSVKLKHYRIKYLSSSACLATISLLLFVPHFEAFAIPFLSYVWRALYLSVR